MKRLALSLLFLFTSCLTAVAQGTCPYTAPVIWYWTVSDTNPATTVFSTNTGDASRSLPADSPGTFVTIAGDTTYTAWQALGCSATVIDTAANLYAVINTYNTQSLTATTYYGLPTLGASSTLTLSNPITSAIDIITSGAGPNRTVILPQMNLPGSIPIGVPFTIVNDTTSIKAIILKYQDGTTSTPLSTGYANIPIGVGMTFMLKNNNTPNGTVVPMGTVSGVFKPLQGGTGTSVPPTDAQILVALSGTYQPNTMSGDCTNSNLLVITCTKLNGVSPGTLFPLNVGAGLAPSGGSIVNNATEHISFQPGLVTSVVNTKGAFHKFSKASTVDNIEGSATSFTCAGNPTITVYECGTSPTCAGPTTIGTVTVTAAGTVVDGTVSNPAITAGDYVAFAISAGTCTSLDIMATVQAHQN
jgi:hypothetical protein